MKGSATLKLSTGTYYAESVTLEAQSKLLLDQAAGPVTIYLRQGLTIRGKVTAVAASTTPDPLFVVLGSSGVFVDVSFSGTIVVPNASLTLGQNRPSTFVGAFFGRDVVVGPGTVLQRHVSRAWSTLPACRALTAAEQAKANAAGLAPALYPVSGVELAQQWPIPFGQQWLVGLRYDSGTGRSGTGSRFRVLSLFQNQVKGGNTFVLRQ